MMHENEQNIKPTDISDALTWISSDCDRDAWVRILMAIKSALGDAGRDVAEDWSARADSYQPAAFRATWRSIKEGGGITVATLFKLAADAGYRPGGFMKPPPMPEPRPVAPEPPATLPYARAIWDRVNRDDAHVAAHPYARRKGIEHAAGAGRATASGTLLGRDADCIVIPLRTYPEEQFCGVECVNEEGKKQTFGSKGVLILGNDLDASLPQLVCEGWACGVGLFLLYHGNVAVYCAFSKGRLPSVAKQLEARHPLRQTIVCKEADA